MAIDQNEMTTELQGLELRVGMQPVAGPTSATTMPGVDSDFPGPDENAGRLPPRETTPQLRMSLFRR